MKKWMLIFFPAVAFAAPLDISEAGCPTQVLDIVSGQLMCVVPPEPEPEPPPPMGACATGPNLNNFGPVTGQWFTDCGVQTQLRSPSPTSLYYHIGASGTSTQGSGYSMCVAPGSIAAWEWNNRYPNGTVNIYTSDQDIHITDVINGRIVVHG